MAETPEQKYNRIAAAVQQTILNNFPNPNRVGCPGEARVRAVAARSAIVEDDDWQHITHCSECYREFLDAKEQIRRSGRRARTLGLIGGTALLLLVVAVIGYQYFDQGRLGRETVAISYVPAALNLKDASEVRGDANTSNREIPTVPRQHLELTVILPFGTEAGVYQFAFKDASGHVLASGQANATLQKGTTEFTVRVDLSNVASGDYRFQWRHEPFDWVLAPVRVI